jgi:hypothetical protein
MWQAIEKNQRQNKCSNVQDLGTKPEIQLSGGALG